MKIGDKFGLSCTVVRLDPNDKAFDVLVKIGDRDEVWINSHDLKAPEPIEAPVAPSVPEWWHTAQTRQSALNFAVDAAKSQIGWTTAGIILMAESFEKFLKGENQ